ncbi:UpxY family transcription antiterminator [Prolixibacter sp. SD074]|jgi:transcription antitermination factor NusG|uniref:UpxY family transcription antiterminator n=1 Tax=Prolixibacter sp. SD074 TaxID=2652391 RepID=UPI00188DCB4F|nr:UpxY family transcription antiterminator [Prolixibacter sp. SD074]
MHHEKEPSDENIRAVLKSKNKTQLNFPGMEASKELSARWYAIYVKSRSEKKVLQTLTEKGIDAYLPIYKKLRQWSDRKKLVEMPLMPGYVFVHITWKDYDRVLQTDHVVCYITFGGKAAPVRDEDIESLKHMLRQDKVKVELTREDLAPGEQVEILSGPLVGMKGELIQIKGKNKVGIRIQPVGYTVMVEVPISELAIIR